MNKSKQMCELITPYICPVCGKPTLFFVTKFNKIIDYKLLMNKQTTLSELTDLLSNNRITKIKCIQCNNEYMIDWSGGYPTAVTDLKVLEKFGYRSTK